MLLIEPSSNKAEEIISSLRNKGYAVRATQVLNSDELSQALEKGVADLLLANVEHKDFSAKQAVEQISAYGRDIPCLILMKTYDESILVKAMGDGVFDGVSIDNLALICLKVEQAFAALENRRKRIKTELTLKAAEKRCNILLDHSQDAIAYIHEGMHVYANKAYLELFDYADLDELMCIPTLDMIGKTSQDEFRQYLKLMSTDSEQQNFSFTGIKSNTEQFEAIMTLSVANYDDEACTQLQIRSAADNAELEEKLKELSAQDSLTDLFNKQYFTEKLQQSITAANEQGVVSSVLYIEYDQYDSILKDLGMAGIDKVTIECANWLTKQAPQGSLLARISDHSFALLLTGEPPQKSKDHASQLCEKVVNHLFDIEGTTVKLTFSIGVCPVGEGSNEASQVLSDAHSTASRVEEGNGFKLYSKAIQGADNEIDAKMLEKLQEAIESQRMILLFQPIAKIHGEDKAIYQVFLQLTDNEGNILDSEKVFTLAKAAGFGEKIDRWIINQTLKTIKTEKIASNTQLFINLNSVSLIDESLVGFIDKLFNASGVSKNNVVFQIDETDAANHLKRVITLCSTLKEKGYQLSLSGYGNDPEQKALIDQLNVDFVKIVGTKTKAILTEPETAEHIQHLLDEIHKRDMQSIIPRVEEAAMLATLWPMNVKYIQGYYLQKPSEKMDYDFSASGF